MTLNNSVIGDEIFFQCLLIFIQLFNRRNFFIPGAAVEEEGGAAREDDTRCGQTE